MPEVGRSLFPACIGELLDFRQGVRTLGIVQIDQGARGGEDDECWGVASSSPDFPFSKNEDDDEEDTVVSSLSFLVGSLKIGVSPSSPFSVPADTLLSL